MTTEPVLSSLPTGFGPRRGVRRCTPSSKSLAKTQYVPGGGAEFNGWLDRLMTSPVPTSIAFSDLVAHNELGAGCTLCVVSVD